MAHPVDVHVGKQLKALRTLRGLTQTDIAKGLDLSFQQVQKYELGRNRVSASKLYELGNLLNVAPGFFYEGLDQVKAGAPVIDEETARAAALFAKLKDEQIKAKVRALLEAVAASESTPMEASS
jgi:transcriptional regulator with XRE-family HTH domain